MTDLAGLQLLRRIEEGVAGKSGEAFFRQIVRDLTLALNAHAAFTSRLLPERRAEMLAFWVDGRYEKCNKYSLAGTPCEFVYNGRIVSFARDIGNIFPVDKVWFEELGVQSYLGVPIVSETGEVHGHLAVMDKPERDWREADVDIAGFDGVWALGDCAAVPNKLDGKISPPTAQFADRQARQLARNIASRLQGRRTSAFSFKPVGQLSTIGHNKAVAEMFGIRLSGFVAWLLWRGVYLLKIPTFARKSRLFLEWNWAMFFPPDISHLGYRRTRRGTPVATTSTGRAANG